MTRRPAASGKLDALLEAALAARANAHAPYSRFAVGAAILASDGRIYAGTNFENAAFPLGLCAEAAAIAAMVAGGANRIEELLVVAGGRALCTPCGGCRQRIREFAGERTRIHVAGPRGLRRSFTLAELLPHAFGPGNLR
ncbi:MAG: cytidine deaminase [Rhodospirillales bacterium]|nr:cytidine deaminase [Rhodospirillales bacterium]